jgi:phosphoribosyl 1,2-cyclic phosphodiesterase
MDETSQIRFFTLSSGSSGNASCVQLLGGEAPGIPGIPETPRTTRTLLIDAGLSIKATRRHLADRGIELESVTDLFLTHLDADHYNPSWNRTIATHGITVHTHRRHSSRATSVGIPGASLQWFDGPFALDPQTSIEPVLMAHDALGTVAFIIEHGGLRLGFATDLGRVGDGLIAAFIDLDGLAIESNYDRGRQLASNRPSFLKARIMGGSGHLSNDQSLEAVMSIAERSDLQQICLLHLSSECNGPEIIKDLWMRRAPHLCQRVVISQRGTPTPWLDLRSRQPAGL